MPVLQGRCCSWGQVNPVQNNLCSLPDWTLAQGRRRAAGSNFPSKILIVMRSTLCKTQHWTDTKPLLPYYVNILRV